MISKKGKAMKRKSKKPPGSGRPSNVIEFPKSECSDDELHEMLQELIDSGHKALVEMHLVVWRGYFLDKT
jgi:hypothetical protein